MVMKKGVLDQEGFVLVMQIINSMEQSYLEFENTYKSGDKRKFENAKKAILDFQIKLDRALKG